MDKPHDVVNRVIEEEMKQAYLDYSMSVIVGRALPDARDGLKPVHRRILFAMKELGMLHNRPFKKSARIVGEVLGKFHPHGDLAVYDALVRMVQDFSLRYPLVNGQGNFGSVDGDNAAAMRYTEVRLARVAEELLEDIDKETVPFVPNFDGTGEEPVVLPAKAPNLLINGSSGIAVGMATSIPPHNLGEVADAVTTLLDNPSANEELLNIVKGPDFPTGGMIRGRAGIREAYAKGRGNITVRAKASIERKHDRDIIIVTEIPFQVNKSLLIEEIADLVKEKHILGISDLRDESDREGMRIVIELRKDANAEVVLNQLYAHSKLEVGFSIMMVALVGKEPKTLSLKELISQFINHRQEVIRKRTAFDLRKAEEQAHILQGLIRALDSLDAVIKLIRSSKDASAARQQLIAQLGLTEIQSQAILDMKLQRLAALEQEKIREDHKSLLKEIQRLQEILSSEEKIRGIIKEDMAYLKQVYADKRRTEIIDAEETEIVDEDLIEDKEMVVTITRSGYIKRVPLEIYREQRRGGKGIIGAETREEDVVEQIFVARNKSTMLFFTDKGMVHWLKVYEVPEASRQSLGKAIVNLLSIENEKITAVISVREFDDSHYLIMATKQGTIKKTRLDAFSHPRKGGIIAMLLGEDTLINVAPTTGESEVILATKEGMAVRFHESQLRPIGRSSHGVRGIRLQPGDEVIGMVVAAPAQNLLTVTEHGYGKRTKVSDYRLVRRGGKGVINIKPDERNGHVVSVITASDDESLLIVTRNGIVIRTPSRDISVIGRNTKGVRIMKLDESDTVVSVTKVENGN